VSPEAEFSWSTFFSARFSTPRLHLAVGPRFAACVIQIFGISVAARQVVHALIFMLQFFVLRHEQQVFAAVCDFIVCISGLDFVACFCSRY
jgi:hypothetical protein